MEHFTGKEMLFDSLENVRMNNVGPITEPYEVPAFLCEFFWKLVLETNMEFMCAEKAFNKSWKIALQVGHRVCGMAL